MSGCHCPRCDQQLPHPPVDALVIARALRHDPPVHGPARRILASYDAKPVKKPVGGDKRAPWEPRAPRQRRTPRAAVDLAA